PTLHLHTAPRVLPLEHRLHPFLQLLAEHDAEAPPVVSAGPLFGEGCVDDLGGPQRRAARRDAPDLRGPDRQPDLDRAVPFIDRREATTLSAMYGEVSDLPTAGRVLAVVLDFRDKGEILRPE